MRKEIKVLYNVYEMETNIYIKSFYTLEEATGYCKMLIRETSDNTTEYEVRITIKVIKQEN